MSRIDDYLESVEYDLSVSSESSKILQSYSLGSLMYQSDYSQIFKIQAEDSGKWFTLKAISKKSRLTLDGDQLKDIRHDRISNVIAFSETDLYYYIIKPYIEGVSLRMFVKEHGPLPPETVMNFLCQLVDVLKYLHDPSRKIVYRDLKPENIVVTPDLSLYFIDLETIRIIKPRQNSDTVNIASRGYSAPEQYGFSQTDQRSDIFSLGATLYFLFTGQAPHRLDYDTDLLPQPWSDVVAKCMAFNPSDRYQSVEALMDALHLKKSFKPKLIWLFIVILFLGVGAGFSTLIPNEKPVFEQVEPAELTNDPLSLELSLEYFKKKSEALSDGIISPKGLSGILNNLPLDDGTYPFGLRIINDFGEFVQTGSRISVKEGQAHFECDMGQSEMPLLKGYEYTFIAFIETSDENLFLDWAEPYAKVTQIYNGRFVNPLIYNDWSLYTGEVVNGFHLTWGYDQQPDDFYQFMFSLENVPMDGTYDLYLMISDQEGQMNQTWGQATIIDGKSTFSARMPKSSIFLKENHPHDLTLYIDHLIEDANLNPGESYSKKIEVYRSKPVWKLNFDYWHIHEEEGE